MLWGEASEDPEVATERSVRAAPAVAQAACTEQVSSMVFATTVDLVCLVLPGEVPVGLTFSRPSSAVENEDEPAVGFSSSW